MSNIISVYDGKISTTAEKKFIFTWEIENFNLCLLENDDLRSPEFMAKTFKSTSWCLELSIDESEKYISCFLIRTRCSAEDVSIKFTFQLINSDNDPFASLPEEISTFSKNHTVWGVEKLCEINKFENVTGSIIIRCIMALHESVEEISMCKGRTKIVVDRSCFRWNIKTIKSASWKESKIFPCSPSVHIQITLTAPEDFVDICIKKVDKEKAASHYVSCKLSLLDSKEVEDSRRSEHLFKSDEENATWQFPQFLKKSKLQVENNKYLKNSTFTLMCIFAIYIGDSIDYIEEYDNNKRVSVYSVTKEDSLSVLQGDLKRMFAYNLQSDVNLRAENRTFQAHKFILSARSPVFAAMFKQDMLENQTGIVDIPDVDAEILKSFLKFAYTGTVDNLVYESASKLLVVADKYQVSSLKNKCSSFLMSNLSIANVCNVAVIAGMVGEEALRTYAMDYIAAHAEVIFISEDWLWCIQNDTKLAMDMFRKLSILEQNVSKIV